jgi:oligopeptide/dipeptide ABC transporter ATP-binding protein
MAVEHLSHRIAVMYLGYIVEQAPTATIMVNPRHPYTRALVSSVLSHDPTRRLPRNLVVGEIPSAINRRRECLFYSRCPIRLHRCLDDVPAMAIVSSKHNTGCLRCVRSVVEDAPENSDCARRYVNGVGSQPRLSIISGCKPAADLPASALLMTRKDRMAPVQRLATTCSSQMPSNRARGRGNGYTVIRAISVWILWF